MPTSASLPSSPSVGSSSNAVSSSASSTPTGPSSSRQSSTTTTSSSSTTSTSSLPANPPSTITSTSSFTATSTTSTTSTQETTTSLTSPTRTDPPLQTLLSTVFVATTDSLGHTTISAPSAITSVVTFTSDGITVTSTEIKLNPTLGSDGHSSGGSSFFKNTGAVAGVFVLVGLAAAAIVLWIIFGLRQRRRTRRIEHDTAVSATLAAAGFHRAPLDDDELHGNTSMSRAFASDMEMRTGSALALRTNSSIPSAERTSGYQDSPGHDEAVQESFNPYHEVAVPREGYIPARTHSPPPAAFVEPYRDASGPDHPITHSASQSVGSTEPLLAAFNRASQVSPAPSSALLRPPTPPPRNPKRVSDRPSQMSVLATPRPRLQSTGSSVYSVESTGDERLNPALRNSDIQDSEDYTRPVLGVRNVPDGVSQVSRES
ncbi:hypothetical protein GGX14DRAFT_489624 [Mycena pura]|uniref:Uncharacterized protein n=1 Tax=Mycena pura TaxID=153505 RepID=A0AAD7E2T9_9AGAR|nr:hypothetical protein GGX14DRAFT_489624 [Mycena pura]